MPTKPHLITELMLLLTLSTVWGASYTFIRISVETIPPITLVAVRTLIAGLILLSILYLRGQRMPMDRKTWIRFAAQAILNSIAPFTLIAWAERTTEAGLAAILNSMTPLFTFLLTALVTRHEPVTMNKLFGVVIGLVGACLIIGADAVSGFGHTMLADLAIVAATLFYAGAAIFGKSFKEISPLAPAAGTLLCASVLLTPISLAIERPWTLQPSSNSIAALLALSVFSTALAFAIYFRLMRTLGSLGATAQAYLRAPVGVAIGVVFLGEIPAPTAWIGLACVMAGVVAMTRQS